MVECQSEKTLVQSEKRLVHWVGQARGAIQGQGVRSAHLRVGGECEDVSQLTLHFWPVLLSGGCVFSLLPF